MNVDAIKTVAVLGAGTMGNGIAHAFARFGYKVILSDVEQDFLDVGGIDGGVDFRARSDTQDRHTSRAGHRACGNGICFFFAPVLSSSSRFLTGAGSDPGPAGKDLSRCLAVDCGRTSATGPG